MKVFEAITKVQAAIVAAGGIGKDHKNQQQGYKFRGIDDVYNTLSPLLASNGLVILPRMMRRECLERQTLKGGALFSVTVEAEFDFIAAEDGSKVTARTFGEAMDSGDKATNKAMSAAYKYACFQTFAIPTDADTDGDEVTHAVRHTPTGEPSLTRQRNAVVQDCAAAILERHGADDLIGAYDEYQGITDAEEKIALWKLLPSNIRTALKKHGESLKGQP